MPNGALIPIGITLLFCAFAFAQPILHPNTLPPRGNLSFSYLATALNLILAIACFIPVISRFKQARYNRKHKIYKKKAAISNIDRNQQTPGDWRSNISNFDLSRLTLAGWVLSFLSVVVLSIGAGISGSILANSGAKQASDAQVKVFGMMNLGVTVAFFMAGKWLMEKVNIKIIKNQK
jgi:hypothetical protein